MLGAIRRSSTLATLARRGLVQDTTSSDLATAMQEQLTFYCGFDPTAPALHVGHMVALSTMAQLQAKGHRAIAVIGGATGRIGDPSGRKTERSVMEDGVVVSNLAGVEENIRRVLANANNILGTQVSELRVLDNMAWSGNIRFVDFLREVGNHVRLQHMLKRESVSARLNTDAGLSYAEFSYQLLQAYDFLHLFDNEKCTLQVCDYSLPPCSRTAWRKRPVGQHHCGL